MKYNWKLQNKIDGDFVDQLLSNRGIDDDSREVFLNPDWDRDVHDPFLFTQMQEAVDRTFRAIKSGQNIVVHGDYDADGICGSTVIAEVCSILATALNVELHFEAFLPHRERDGYGVAMHTIEKFKKDNVGLLITVDCGIANAEELDVAHEGEIDVIICDHHQVGDNLPKNAIIIHPLISDEKYPNKKLSGTGVAFKFACALLIEAQKQGLDIPNGSEKWLLDLVAIATVTDVMLLTGENRVLEKFGLVVLNKTRRSGLRKIIENAGLEFGKINTVDIGYRIGPRINASGRIREAKIAFNTLNAKDEKNALDFALELEVINRERQQLSSAAYEEARTQIEPNQYVNVIWNEMWAPGIVGLVAGKITQETNISTFAFTLSNGQYVGSGRSAGGLHLVEAMKSCGDIFVKAGGHPEACGLTIKNDEMLKLFKERVNKYASSQISATDGRQDLIIDAVLEPTEVTWLLYEDLKKFAPFGKGNPEPILMFKDINITSVKVIGSTGKHLKLKVGSESKSIDCIGFGFGDLGTLIKIGSKVDIAFKIGVNEWNGQRNLQLIIEDIILKKCK